MKLLSSTLLGLAALLVVATAHAAVPTTVPFTGRLRTSSGEVNGNVALTFALYDAQTDGAQVWSESRPTVMAYSGLVFVELGSITPLDETIFDGQGPLYLQVTVGSEVLSPRLPIRSVPYAVRADTADNLGTIAPGDVVTTVNGSGGGIAVSRTTNTVGVSLTTCSAGQILKAGAGGWACSADDNTSYGVAPNQGLAITGTQFGLTSCAAGQVLKSNGPGSWSCQADADTLYTGSAPISVSGTSVSLTQCAANQVYKMNTAGTGWSCAADNDTTYTQGSGIGISANTISVDATVARKDAASGNQAFDTNVLVLDYTNNRVGVGTTSPTTTLHVSGTATASAYEFTSAQSNSIFVSGTAFAEDRTGTDDSWGRVPIGSASYGGYGYMTGSSPFNMELAADVYLPDGASVTALTCYILDNSSTSDLSTNTTARLQSRTFLTKSATTLGTVTMNTSGMLDSVRTFSTTITHTADPQTTAYWIGVNLNVTGTSASFLFLYGCRVSYTFTRLFN